MPTDERYNPVIHAYRESFKVMRGISSDNIFKNCFPHAVTRFEQRLNLLKKVTGQRVQVAITVENMGLLNGYTLNGILTPKNDAIAVRQGIVSLLKDPNIMLSRENTSVYYAGTENDLEKYILFLSMLRTYGGLVHPNLASESAVVMAPDYVLKSTSRRLVIN